MSKRVAIVFNGLSFDAGYGQDYEFIDFVVCRPFPILARLHMIRPTANADNSARRA
jgi:hypothetical protein